MKRFAKSGCLPSAAAVRVAAAMWLLFLVVDALGSLLGLCVSLPCYALSGYIGAVDELAHGIANGIGPAFVAVDVAQRMLIDASAANIDGEHFV